MHVFQKYLIVFFTLIVLAILNVGLFRYYHSLQMEQHVSAATPTTPSPSPFLYPELPSLQTIEPNFGAYNAFFRTLAEEKGGEYAFTVLLEAKVPGFIDTHLLGHEIGEVMYEQRGIEAIETCTNDFRNACAHSIVIGFLTERGERALSQLPDVCHKAAGGIGGYLMCFHGVGHGVIAYTNYNFPKAVKLCEQFGTDPYNKQEYVECVGGATMELVDGVHDQGARDKAQLIYLKNGSPFKLCLAVPSYVRNTCFIYLTPYLFELAHTSFFRLQDDDIVGAFKFCTQLSAETQKEERDSCFAGFGKEFVAAAKGRDIRDMTNLTDSELDSILHRCALAAAPDGIQSCIGNSVLSLSWGGQNTITTPVRFCHRISDAINQAYCFRTLSDSIHFYYRDQLEKQLEICSQLPETYQNACKLQ